jgi:predicted phage terminase large subunit-like protein
MQVREQARTDGIVLAEDAQKVGLWLTPKRGGMFAAGIGGAWTGKGMGGVVVIDDPLKDREEAESFTLRNKAYETITNSVFTRLEPPCGSLIVVATRWHEDDPTGRLLEKSGKDGFPHFEQIVLPALRDPTTNEPSDNDDAIALWPERFPRETLIATRAVLGPYGWASLYQGTPRPRGGHVFKREPARFVVTDEGRHIAGRRLLLSLDAAGTESTRSDFSVCGALAFDGDGESMTCNVVDMLRMQLEPQDSAPRIAEFAARWGNPLLVIEKSRDGVAIAKALARIAPQLRFELVPPIGDKFTRAQPVAAAWNATPSRVAVPIDAPWIDDMLHEHSKFTGMGDKHDDIVDMVSQGWNFMTAPQQQFRDDDEYVL